ncbi:hypothetical protein [Nannocystis bainbridge]|uniref:Uncharacterized protein n=1 Tax=Nannocystis bainbridge TaxID=2995303 RepID=A0ABT5DT41_9BACT|nr:hypothetical protein [Nannocystis bainbridge]MDC0715561.1 hypothetical protein [Nannocystis bainbridge]
MPPTSTPRNYEFSGPENIIIRQLVDAMRFVAAASLAVGAFVLILGIAGLVTQGRAAIGPALGDFAEAVVFVLIGLWLQRAVDAFSRVIDTSGDDITHLLDALRELTRVFSLQRTVLVLAAIVIVMAIGIHGVLSLG